MQFLTSATNFRGSADSLVWPSRALRFERFRCSPNLMQWRKVFFYFEWSEKVSCARKRAGVCVRHCAWNYCPKSIKKIISSCGQKHYVALWPADFLLPIHDLVFTVDHFVSILSAIW